MFPTTITATDKEIQDIFYRDMDMAGITPNQRHNHLKNLKEGYREHKALAAREKRQPLTEREESLVNTFHSGNNEHTKVRGLIVIAKLHKLPSDATEIDIATALASENKRIVTYNGGYVSVVGINDPAKDGDMRPRDAQEEIRSSGRRLGKFLNPPTAKDNRAIDKIFGEIEEFEERKEKRKGLVLVAQDDDAQSLADKRRHVKGNEGNPPGGKRK